mgnify:CR=1 FL=1
MNYFKDADALLRIIDERVAVALNRSGFVKRELALVKEVNGNKLGVVLMRDISDQPPVMTVINKTGEICAVGDAVYVEDNNGVIVNATLRCGN